MKRDGYCNLIKWSLEFCRFGGDMGRNLLPLLCALALTSCRPSAPNPAASPLNPPAQLPSQPQSPQPQQPQAQSSQALVGTWSARINWNLPGGIIITTSFTADGRIQSTTQNRMGMSFMLSGVYQFNPAQGTLSYTWQDYSPKQICVGGNCTPAPAPAPMGVLTISSIRFLNPNEFVSTTKDGSTTFVRTNAAGFPTP
jgi:hypothetical protein